ncbi:MAG: hypothetical protein NVSMB19_15320 [Vulcanimicrobiaceae bacterium]
MNASRRVPHHRVWLLILRFYLVAAVVLVVYKVALLALHNA